MTYTQPLVLLFSLLSIAGLWRARRRRSWWLAWTGVSGLLLISWPPFDWLLSRPLEARYPVERYAIPPGPQAIVVLSSAVRKPVRERPYPLPDGETYERCLFAAWLYRQRPTLPVLASGGSETGRGVPFARTMSAILLHEGVPAEMIWTEECSRSTYENAVYSARLLRRRSIVNVVLVVDAQSMFRAAACFRKQGMTVAPAPSSFREWGRLREELVPGWVSVSRNEVALHELLGCAWYKLRGWM